MGIVYSKLPRPLANLSKTYEKVDSSNAGSITSYIDVGPILFLAPNKIRFYSSATYTISLSEGDWWFRCNIQINCEDDSKVISNNYVTDYDKPFMFSGELTTSSPITSITIPDRGIASFMDDSTGATSASPAISGDFERTIPVVQATSPYIVVKSYKLTHILLPAAPVEGQWFRIKCGINCMAYIHTLGIPIDNTVTTSFVTDSLSTNMVNMQSISGTYTAHGFTMNTLDSCMLIYNGQQWILQEYRNGGPNIDYDGIGGGTIYSYWNTVPVNDLSLIHI